MSSWEWSSVTLLNPFLPKIHMQSLSPPSIIHLHAKDGKKILTATKWSWINKITIHSWVLSTFFSPDRKGWQTRMTCSSEWHSWGQNDEDFFHPYFLPEIGISCWSYSEDTRGERMSRWQEVSLNPFIDWSLSGFKTNSQNELCHSLHVKTEWTTRLYDKRKSHRNSWPTRPSIRLSDCLLPVYKFKTVHFCFFSS